MSKEMKTIGIDARFYGEAGPGRYAKAIVEHLEKVDKHNKYKIFLRDKGFDLYQPGNKNFEKIKAPYSWYSWEEQLPFLFQLIKNHLDLFYVPHFNIPVLYPGNIITAIPDIIMHTFSTEKGTTLPRWYFKFKKFIYKFVVYWAVLRSKKVIVPSKAVIEDFVRVYPNVPREKYILAYEGVDPVFIRSSINTEKVLEKYQIKKPFLLYISSMYEHKNVPFLIKGFVEYLEKSNFTGCLVLIGKKDKFSEQIQKLVKEKGLESKVLMPSMEVYVSDEELVALRKEALGYVFPSLKEGFSLTPLEAQAVGLPCLISNIDVHTEIYEDSVMYFNPNDLNDLVSKLKKFISDAELREILANKGYELIKKYSWDNTAKITYQAFERFL